MRRPVTTLPCLLVGLAVALMTLAGCGGKVQSAGPIVPPDMPSFREYAALGDSYTAAPGVPPDQPDQPCGRSKSNYPSQLAAALKVETFRDVSCAGASTANVTKPQVVPDGTKVPPQILAVHANTDLVTVSLGANNLLLLGQAMSPCTKGQCNPRERSRQLAAKPALIRPAIERILKRVHKRAPHATVLLIGYPRILPDGMACRDLPPQTPADVQVAADALTSLNTVMSAAADATDTYFVDLSAATAGHEICTDEPWINGIRNSPDRAVALHPFRIEQDTAAQLVVRRLSSIPRTDG